MAQLVKKALRKNKDIKHWIKYFDDYVVLSLIDTSLHSFSGYKFKDFKSDSTLGNLTSTTKFYDVLHTVIDKFSFSEKFFAWYDHLTFDDMEEFNKFIKLRILEFANQA